MSPELERGLDEYRALVAQMRTAIARADEWEARPHVRAMRERRAETAAADEEVRVAYAALAAALAKRRRLDDLATIGANESVASPHSSGWMMEEDFVKYKKYLASKTP